MKLSMKLDGEKKEEKMNRPNKKDYCNGWLHNTDKYVASLEQYCDELEQRCLSDEWELACLDKDYKKIEKKLMKALWALSELMGDKGIYIRLGWQDLHFATFEELRKWIENE